MAKYAERRYVLRREEADPARLYDAVRGRDINSLLQLYAEGADLAKPLTLPEGQVKILYSHKWMSTPAFLPEMCPVRARMHVINPYNLVTNSKHSQRCHALRLNDSYILASQPTWLV